MLESLVVYGLLFFVMYGCGISAARKRRKYIAGSGLLLDNDGRFLSVELVVLILSFAFVFGCRWGVGRDFYRYLYAYTGEIPERFEFLFQLIMSSLKRVGAHSALFFGIIALIDVLLLYYTARNYKFIFPLIAFFLIFGSYYLPMMNAMRQFVAAQIFMVSISYIDQKKVFHFAICFILAVLFHRLSLILFIFYPLLRWRRDEVSWALQ